MIGLLLIHFVLSTILNYVLPYENASPERILKLKMALMGKSYDQITVWVGGMSRKASKFDVLGFTGGGVPPPPATPPLAIRNHGNKK